MKLKYRILEKSKEFENMKYRFRRLWEAETNYDFTTTNKRVEELSTKIKLAKLNQVKKEKWWNNKNC